MKNNRTSGSGKQFKLSQPAPWYKRQHEALPGGPECRMIRAWFRLEAGILCRGKPASGCSAEKAPQEESTLTLPVACSC